jgi:hypothetical protein
MARVFITGSSDGLGPPDKLYRSLIFSGRLNPPSSPAWRTAGTLPAGRYFLLGHRKASDERPRQA